MFNQNRYGYGGISTTLPAYPKDHIGKLIYPGTMAKPFFFGWWATTGIDV
jgi:hypothetical protein